MTVFFRKLNYVISISELISEEFFLVMILNGISWKLSVSTARIYIYEGMYLWCQWEANLVKTMDGMHKGVSYI